MSSSGRARRDGLPALRSFSNAAHALRRHPTGKQVGVANACVWGLLARVHQRRAARLLGILPRAVFWLAPQPMTEASPVQEGAPHADFGAPRSPAPSRWPPWLHFLGRLLLVFLVIQVFAGLALWLERREPALEMSGDYSFELKVPVGEAVPRTLRTSSDDGRTVTAACEPIAGRPGGYLCSFAGSHGDLLALLDETDRQMPEFFMRASHVRNMVLTPNPRDRAEPLMPWWAHLPGLLLIAYWRRRDGETLGPMPFSTRWLWWLPVPMVLGLLTAALLGTEELEAKQDFAQSFAAAPIATAMLIALLGPLFEELVFRGVGWTVLRPRYGFAATLAWTSLPFALVHFASYGVAGVLGTLVTGMTLGWLREKSGSVTVPFLAHALNNGVFMILLALAPAMLE